MGLDLGCNHHRSLGKHYRRLGPVGSGTLVAFDAQPSLGLGLEGRTAVGVVGMGFQMGCWGGPDRKWGVGPAGLAAIQRCLGTVPVAVEVGIVPVAIEVGTLQAGLAIVGLGRRWDRHTHRLVRSCCHRLFRSCCHL